MGFNYLPGRSLVDSIGSTARRWLKGWFGYLDLTGYITLAEGTAAPTPAADKVNLYCAVDGTTSKVYVKDQAGTVTCLMDPGAASSLDGCYDYGGAGSGKAITVDSGAVALANTGANNNGLLTINKTPVGAQSGDLMTITAGANCSGDCLQFANSGTGADIKGSGDTWNITKAGVLTVTGLTLTGGVSCTTLTATGAVALGNGTGAVVVDSSTWDINAAGAFSGVTAIGMTGDITFATTKGIKSSATTAQTLVISAYDVDAAAYVGCITLTNGNTPTIAIGTGVCTVAIDSTTWDMSAAGALSGCTGLSFLTGSAATITLASDGAADDLTISVTGANDSSLVLASAGTGEDAIGIQASAGGIDVDALAGKDINIAGGQVALVSKDNAASAISLTANIGTSETIVVTNTQGTSESAITLVSTAGGVNVDAAAAKDLDLAGGQVKLVSKDDAAGAISLTANIGTTETITVTNTQGTSESAITLLSTAGGVNVDAAAAKDIDLSGGQVLVSSKDNAASAIALTTNVGTTETIVVTNTQGTGAGAITLTAAAGGITATVASGKAITLNGTANFKQGSNIASPGGAELTLGEGNFFLITGTNNITSIAAASSTAGRMVTLIFDGVLTFTDGGNLKLAGNFVTSADDSITLMCNGTNWYEMARSAN
jgi:hypothetical protein